ncbi:unnamed protein product [Microthlaspi erraticum]|uniref:Uncharacterized protein n=1 Tax=Microthlaspi erraticum TaxID=1685480 RepID=A0A6D2J4U1_9BRAS|nr:unnamed protein product [Microthlaspi erraticum]
MKSLGRTLPGSDGTFGRGTRDELRGREALLPGCAAWSCAAAWRCGVADRGLKFPGSYRDRPSGFGLWPRLQTDGYSFGRARNIRSSASRTARLGADSR